MADYVAETNCGLVLEVVTPEAILTAVEALKSRYQTLQKSAQAAGQRDFSQQAMIASYQAVYTDILKNGAVTQL